MIRTSSIQFKKTSQDDRCYCYAIVIIILCEDEFFNCTGINPNVLCGFLTPLCSTLSSMPATLVVLGTQLTLASAEHVYTAVGKDDLRFTRITHFPWCRESQVEEML